jgi:hypothetical protein
LGIETSGKEHEVDHTSSRNSSQDFLKHSSSGRDTREVAVTEPENID